MERIRKQFKLWETRFQNMQYQVIHGELKSFIAESNTSSENTALLAYWCLVSLNISSKKSMSNDSMDLKHLTDLYKLSAYCCDRVSKSWTFMDCDFVTSVFYICKILINRNRVREACDVGQFVFRYFDEVPSAKLAFKVHEINVPSRFMCLLLNAALNFDPKLEKENLIHLWNTILSKPERRIVRTNISSVIEYFSSFLQKLSNDNFPQYQSSIILLIKVLNHGINLNGSTEEIFFTFFRISVNKLCEFSSRNNFTFFLNCLNYLEKKSSPAIQFCENVYRICSGIFEDRNAPETINISNNELRMLIENDISYLNDVIYCASTIIVKMQIGKMNDYALDNASAQNLFTILLTLARRLYDIDINELFLGKKERTKKIDVGSVAVLSTEVIASSAMIKNLDLKNEKIYQILCEAEKLAITCVKSLDEKRREKMEIFFGASCTNLCRVYMMADLHSHCINLCVSILQYYSTLPSNQLNSTNLKLFVSKLVLCICCNYRSLEKFEDWMNTALSWSLITPVHASVFMEQYCTAKYKLFSKNITSPYLDYTYVELLKKKENQWKHKNLETSNPSREGLMELKAYLTHNLILAQPVEKLIELLESQNSSDRILLGTIYFAKFRLSLFQFRKKNEAELKALAPNKTDPSSQENEYVLAGYTFNNQKDILKFLNASVDHWAAAIEECSRTSHPQGCLKELELSYLKEAALIYRLYCEHDKEVDVWKLLFVASKCINDEALAIYAFSNLMCTSWKINLKWMKEVEEIMLPKADEALKLRYQLDSWNGRITKDFTSKEKEFMKRITLDYAEKHNLQAKYCYFMAQVHFHKIFEETTDPFGMCYKAISTLMESLKNVKWNNFAEACELQCILLDVSVFMVARCSEKFEFHNAKKFAQEPFKIVQALGLSLRTCQFLNLTAFLDTIVGSIEDCCVKLQYASSILDYTVKLEVAQSTGATGDRQFVRNDYDIDFEDNPALNSELQFVMPAFANHPKKCECDICANAEYLKLYCEVTSLYGIYFRLLKKWSQADGFFQGVFKLIKFARKRIDVVELKASALIQCGNYWAAKNCFEEATLCTQKAQKVFHISRGSNIALKEFCIDQCWQQFAVQFFKEYEISTTIQREPKGIPRLNLLEQLEAPSNRKHQKAVETAPVTPCPRKSRKVLLFDDFSTPPSETTSENKEFTTPPAVVMKLPTTTQIRRTRRRLNERK